MPRHGGGRMIFQIIGLIGVLLGVLGLLIIACSEQEPETDSKILEDIKKREKK